MWIIPTGSIPECFTPDTNLTTKWNLMKFWYITNDPTLQRIKIIEFHLLVWLIIMDELSWYGASSLILTTQVIYLRFSPYSKLSLGTSPSPSLVWPLFIFLKFLSFPPFCHLFFCLLATREALFAPCTKKFLARDPPPPYLKSCVRPWSDRSQIWNSIVDQKWSIYWKFHT